MPSLPLLAVDIGNARIKIGLFRCFSGEGLPEPERVLPLEGERPALERIGVWLDKELPALSSAQLSWFLASVNRPATTRLLDWLGIHRPGDRVTLLSSADLPLDVRLERPDMVGIDRLLDAVAANRLRNLNMPTAIVDVGSAITVDLLSAEGSFLGGAILSGLAMSARALHEFTDLLPVVETSDFHDPPPPLGTCTEEAMRSGLFWGAVGAIRQLIEELGRHTGAEPQVFLTGGAGFAIAKLLGPNARHVPHLTLAGIALSACE